MYVNLQTVERYKLSSSEERAMPAMTQQTLGDSGIASGFSSLASSLGVKPSTLLLLLGGGLLAGWVGNNLFTSAKRKVRRTTRRLRRGTRALREKSVAFAQPPTSAAGINLLGLLLVAVAGGAVYYMATRSTGGQA